MTDHTCPQCGELLPSGRRSYCSDKCKLQAKYIRQKARGIPQAKWSRRKAKLDRPPMLQKSLFCDETLCESETLARSKCAYHYRLLRASEGATWAVEALNYRGNDYKQRAKRYGVYYEKVDRDYVFRRDNWICGICGEPVDPNAEETNKRPSLDHIDPLSKGGPHSYENVQLAHFGCNCWKCDRILS